MRFLLVNFKYINLLNAKKKSKYIIYINIITKKLNTKIRRLLVNSLLLFRMLNLNIVL